jgi:hypothetical protein
VCSDLSVPTRPFVRRAETKQSVEETGVVTSDFDYWHILAITVYRCRRLSWTSDGSR